MFCAITAFLLSRFVCRLTASLGWCLSSNSCKVLCRLTEGIPFLSNSYTCTLQSWGGVSKVGNIGARPLLWSMSERMSVIMTCLPDSCFCTLCNLIFITYTSNIIINSPSSFSFLFNFFSFYLPYILAAFSLFFLTHIHLSSSLSPCSFLTSSVSGPNCKQLSYLAFLNSIHRRSRVCTHTDTHIDALPCISHQCFRSRAEYQLAILHA